MFRFNVRGVRNGRGARKVTAALAASVVVTGLVACSSTDAVDAKGGEASEVAAAKMEVERLLEAPTSIGVSTPLTSAPEGLGDLVFLSCENALCQVLAEGMGEAATAAGIGFRNRPIKLADPASLIQGMKDALAMSPKPSGVVFAGLPEAVWGAMIPAFEKAAVPLIPIAVGETSKSPALPAGSLDGPADARAQAEAVANFFIADSEGAGKSVLLSVPDVGALRIIAEHFLATVTDKCTGCSAKAVDVSLAQVAGNQVVPAVVSAVQRNPDVKYVVTVHGEFTQGIGAALKAAGRPDVKLIGVNPAEFNQQDLLRGETLAFSSLPFHIMAWKAVDAVLRYQQALPIELGNGPLPLQLLTKETVGTPQKSIDRPEDYQEQFKKLWQVK